MAGNEAGIELVVVEEEDNEEFEFEFDNVLVLAIFGKEEEPLPPRECFAGLPFERLPFPRPLLPGLFIIPEDETVGGDETVEFVVEETLPFVSILRDLPVGAILYVHQ